MQIVREEQAHTYIRFSAGRNDAEADVEKAIRGANRRNGGSSSDEVTGPGFRA